MNALFDEIQRLAPGYELTEEQRRAVDAGPDEYAIRLPQQLDNLRRHMLVYINEVRPDLGLTEADIPADLLMPEITDFSTTGSRGSHWASVSIAKRVNPEVWMQIERRRASDFLAWVYDRYLNRAPDDGGHAYYTAQLEAGRPEWEIVREISMSKEARGIR